MKNLFKLSLVVAGLFSMAACGSNQQDKANTTDTATTMQQDTTSAPVFTAAMVDNKKDPTCGMPVTAGINDTAHFENKILGFCSTECKNEFLKNPKANIAAAELK